ncbi:hypothetical protein BOTBODRAFT_36630 [Botryobasidium botryosum FD-172 SS1]|uniref:DUF2423 domain-containing protein n=1 Tax=Botryobasidium botryosum (strain FD-172 SS1) TaxID=930990 RepID=A0A067M2K7_BOTB1|nr:hypothetical protein BOTBODRAFT_36630 [Botryobasidium botryosum FD-172 SS1]
MAKSTRSKVKRSFRRTKRETGVFAAHDAARLQRLSAKLKSVVEKDKDGDVPILGAQTETEAGTEAGDKIDAETRASLAGDEAKADNPQASMDIDGAKTKKVSTHGPRDSRRNSWRKSKGMPTKRTGGGGRAHRRR